MMQERIGNKSEIPWSNATKGSLNFVLAQILESRGRGVHISEEARDINGRRIPGDVAIYASEKGARLLNSIEDTPELEALQKIAFTVGEPELDECRWDDDTKRRVMASWWSKKATILRRITRMHARESKNPYSYNLFDIYYTQCRRAEREAQNFLGDLKPLTARDLKRLIKQVVDRELEGKSKI